MSKFLDLTGLAKVVENVKKEIKTEVVNADHLKRKKVEALPSAAEADVNTIYMVSKTDSTGENDIYDEYMFIDGKAELMGNSKVDLTDYAKSADVEVQIQAAKTAAEEYADSLAGDYATAAQGKKADTAVQSVKIGSKELKSGTTVTIPTATASAAGVMSNTDKKKLDEITAITTEEIDNLFTA